MEQKIVLEDSHEIINLLGENDEHLRLIRKEFAAKIIVRGNEILIIGDEETVKSIHKLFTELLTILRDGYNISTSEVKYGLRLIKQKKALNLVETFSTSICVSERGRLIRPKTSGQRRYVQAIKESDIVIGIGPAGTGKTYLAMACAISALNKGETARIILTRPAVEAGERLGFLPGGITEKVYPYLLPLYDVLYDMIGVEKFQRLIADNIIEIAPLAFMRGRTLNDSFIILDEAQNTTPEQMKMFLTRLGFDSKTVITGDITQIDLKEGTTSGLIQIQHILGNIPRISFIYFEQTDVVRHSLVQHIVKAYEEFEARGQKAEDRV
ncbi:MAG: PhoH family protein [bacterium]|nr:PhoH family protein [bacterium]